MFKTQWSASTQLSEEERVIAEKALADPGFAFEASRSTFEAMLALRKNAWNEQREAVAQCLRESGATIEQLEDLVRQVLEFHSKHRLALDKIEQLLELSPFSLRS